MKKYIKADVQWKNETLDDDEIVFFVDGKLKYHGWFGADFTNALIKMCKEDKRLCRYLGSACNSLGDDELVPDIEDPVDVGETIAEITRADYNDSDEEFGFYDEYDWGEIEGPIVECFLAKDLVD